MGAHEELAQPAVDRRVSCPRATTLELVARTALLGATALPALALSSGPIEASPVVALAATAVAVAMAALTWRLAGRGRLSVGVAGSAVLISCFLVPYCSYPGSGFVVAALLGAGIGPLIPRPAEVNPWTGLATAAAIGALILVRALGGTTAACWTVAIGTLLTVAFSLWRPTSAAATKTTWPRPVLASLTVVYGAFAIFWVGSTAPTVTWFGSVRSHGPRDVNEVAITFDDGPNAPFTLQIADILEQHAARGTFFEVGKAVVQEPEVTKELLARGHVVGNHSYNHGAFSYLDPTYPELAQTQRAFRDSVGVCPGLFRPPHGTHTPFMSHIVDNAGMTLATWDVSAQDWVETDPARLARNILDKVKPGSVILLHDGSDGNIGADRSVILAALPTILDGLRAKGLTPVTLDKLLGVPATAPCPS